MACAVNLPTGKRRHDRGVLTMALSSASDTYSITNIGSQSFERLVATRAPSFTDATQSLGLDKLQSMTVKKRFVEAVTLVVADYDKDGRSDMLVGITAPSS